MFFFQRIKQFLVLAIVLLVLAFNNYVRSYEKPSTLFWDETYHVASAQKYLDGVFFMECHPPLAKMLIALGEKIFKSNAKLDTHSLADGETIKQLPEGFSFKGVRLFPSLAAWLNSLLFFAIFYQISKKESLAFVFSLFYVYENGFITHSRGAMLESIQIFFILISFLFFLKKLESKTSKRSYFFLGLIVGLAVAVKLNSLFIILLMPSLFLAKRVHLCRSFLNLSKEDKFKVLYDFVVKGLIFSTTLAAVVAVVFYIHFNLCKRVQNDQKFSMSKEYQEILEKKQTASLLSFPVMMRDTLRYMDNFQKGVPPRKIYDKNENGSSPLNWPVGGKAISYAWAKDGGKTSYLYLIGNPVVWLYSFAAVILALVLVLAKFLFNLPINNQKLFYKIAIFTGLYVSYMLAVLQIGRVMYLYHYFIPLFISIILLFCMFLYFFEDSLNAKSKIVPLCLVIVVIQVVAVFYYYAPLTYYEPITKYEFLQKNWFDLWRINSEY